MGIAEKLIIYKASAGSGKTFQLTKEYLAILFKNPEAYKNILAVTFTNKATAEMKGRILDELAKIANNLPSPYAEELKEKQGFKHDYLVSKANLILSSVLHDYSRFTVETIDNFFQRVLKSFTKELHIYFNYNLELDTPKIIEQAASQMVFNSHQNKELKQWLSDFAMEKISQGKAWNAKRDIISLGYELFNEQFQLTFKNLDEKGDRKEALREYIATCYNIIDDFEEHLASIGKQAMDAIKSNGFSIDDFSYTTSGIAGYFEKIAQKKDYEIKKRIINASHDFEYWVPKKSQKKEQIFQLYTDSLSSLLDSALLFIENNAEQYESAKEILKLVYAFGILTDLYAQVREVTNEQNIFLLADTGKLIHTIIENNEAPFIYEKLGNVYAHFMIDEFQDTSELQWKNFFPLIQNSLSLGNKNIVVGDVKQAIYRWRNSNWNILGSKIYNQINKEQLNIVNLDKNWRSLKNIVFFNNSFFRNAANYLQGVFNSDVEKFLPNNPYSGTILTAYSELKQNLSKDSATDDGVVDVTFLNNEDWEEQILDELPQLVIKLLNKGFEQSQIAFLVRNKNEGKLVIDKLVDNSSLIFKESGISPNFLSSDALLLKSSKSVKCVIAALKYIISPGEEINKAYLINFINSITKKPSLFHIDQEEEEPEIMSWLEVAGESDNQQSLYSLVSQIIKKLALEQLNEKAFVVAFLDLVLDFSRNNHVSLKSFLDWWEEKEDSLSLNLEQTENAIQVLTIHKSKGLEFDAVIIPFCNWRLDQHASQASIIWCKPNEGPLNAIPVVPLRYSGNLSKTMFKNEYAFEKLNTFIDNINLLYVATTRAKKALFIRSPHPDIIKRGLTSTTLLLNAFSEGVNTNEKGYVQLTDHYNETDLSLKIGELDNNETHFKQSENEVGLTMSDTLFDLNDKLRVRYNHKEFFADDVKPTLINEGKLLHKIFERIIYSDDVDSAIEEIYMDGLISAGEKQNMANEVSKLINQDNVKDWFSRKWKVKTEAEILLPGTIQKRPDRILLGDDKVVVIDYKFGLQQSNKHLGQVEEYVQLLKDMNYTAVEGYLWYVALNRIKKV